MRGRVWAELEGVLALARLDLRMFSPAYGAIAVLGALAALGFGLGTPQPEAGGELRVALRYGFAWSELICALSAAFVGALATGRALSTRRAQTEMARPLSRAGYLAGRLIGAGTLGAVVAFAALATLLLGLVLARGEAAYRTVQPRRSLPPDEILVADARGRPVPAPERLVLEGGADVLLRFHDVGAIGSNEPLRLRLRPSFVLHDGVPGVAAVRVEARLRSETEGPRSVSATGRIAHRRSSEIVLAGEQRSLAPARSVRSVEVLLWCVSDDTIVAFDLKNKADRGAGPAIALSGGRGGAFFGLSALLGGRIVLSLVAAAIALALTVGFGDWTAALSTLVLLLLARFPEFASALGERTGAVHGIPGVGELHGHAGNLGGAWSTWFEALAATLVKLLPDLARLDVSPVVLAGRPLEAAVVFGRLATSLPFIGAVFLLAWCVFARRDLA